MDKGLCNGHAGLELRDALTAEVKARSDTKKAPARDVRAQAQGAAAGTQGDHLIGHIDIGALVESS